MSYQSLLGEEGGIPNFDRPTPRNGDAPTPYNPTTPGVFPPTPLAGGTPAASAPAGGTTEVKKVQRVSDFHTTEILVKIVTDKKGTQFRDGAFNGKEAVILSVNDDEHTCRVKLKESLRGEPDTVWEEVPFGNVEYIRPQGTRMPVKVLTGEHKGLIGGLVFQDANEGTVKMPGSSDIHVFNIGHLGVHVPPA
ncbi:hypothetical protein HK104_007310 [Borealophlyctis nickersoniae]|nr:hypothetical protein HK104_007310 [Borealophlyctis nickersoniae]